ncbi:MAG: ATP-binding protein, partial [Cyanobacteria bacterium]|nr:ATP-binding protein [Cyanobacteriota bacterium]
MTTEKKLEVVFEKGEDATFHYPASTHEPAIVEFVQCKKREKPRPALEEKVIKGWDPWFPGQYSWGDLLKWIDASSDEAPLVDKLQDPAYRYTVLLFGTLSEEIKGFVPGGLGESGNFLDPAVLARVCRAGYEHVKNPDRHGDIRPKSAARRIRIMPFPDPERLAERSETILRRAFQLSPAGAEKVQRSLLERVRRLYLATDEPNRRLTSEEVRQAVESGRESIGAWQQGAEVINRKSTLGGIGADRPVDADLFRTGRFWRHRYLEKAKVMLFQHQAVLVTGAVAAGKTTICKYLIYEFLRQLEHQHAYYLDVRSGTPLNEEIEFFRRQLQLPTLFVIDNEQLAPDEVAKFVELYCAERAPSYLVVTSTRNYNVTQIIRREGPLYALNSVKIDDFISEDFEHLFQACVGDLDRVNPGQRHFAANARQLTRGRIGLVAALGRCFLGRPARPADDRIAEDSYAREVVREWISELLGNPVEPFQDRVVPLMVLASYGIPLPVSYAPVHIARLEQVGLLQENTEGRVEPTEMSIPFLVWLQNIASFPVIVANYLHDNPDELSIVCQRLATNSAGRGVVREL